MRDTRELRAARLVERGIRGDHGQGRRRPGPQRLRLGGLTLPVGLHRNGIGLGHVDLTRYQQALGEQPTVGGERRADRVDRDEGAHRHPRREHGARRPDAAAQPAGAGSGPGADTPFVHRAVARREVGGPTLVRAGVVTPRPGPPEVEEDRGRDDRHDLTGSWAGRPATTLVGERRDDAVRGGQAVGAAARQDDGVDGVDEVAGVEQVGLAGAGPAAAHVDPTGRADGRHDDARPGEPAGLVTGGMADPDARDVGDGVVRSGVHGTSMPAEPAAREGWG